MIERLPVYLQYLLPTRLLSQLVHGVALCRWRLVRIPLIRLFARWFDITLDEARISRFDEFEHFNAFFTRELKADARPLPDDPSKWVSPADGTVSQAGAIEHGRLLQAKGRHYSLPSLVGSGAEATPYMDGQFVTVYLAPNNYHRVHMPADGQLTAMRYIPGRLFSVNNRTATHLPDLFTRNERVICHFRNDRGQWALILVGALLVGGMETRWSGPITPPHGSPLQVRYPGGGGNAVNLSRGDEMGRFNMGSTVILLTEPGMLSPVDSLIVGAELRMGQSIGH